MLVPGPVILVLKDGPRGTDTIVHAKQQNIWVGRGRPTIIHR